MINKNILIVIIVLSAVIGMLIFKLYCKRRKDIIKLSIKRDSLPEAAAGTTWVQGGSCFMKDGKTGRVDGTNCVLIEVL